MSKKEISKDIVDKIIELRKENIGYKRIARMLGIPKENVSRILIKQGYTSHIKIPSKDIIDEIIYRYCDLHQGTRIMAKEMHISASKIIAILMIQGVEITPSGYHVGYKDKIDHNYFDVINTEHKAYWLGFLYADGYNNEKSYQIELTLKQEDAYMLEKLNNDIKSTYLIKKRIVTLDGKQFPCSRLTLYSKRISKMLASKGCFQNKSLSLKFPDFTVVPKNLINHFMRGYFDGDGSISGPKFMLVGTENFIERYAEILFENTTITHRFYTSYTGKALQWGHASKRDLIKIYNFLYKDATISIDRKKERFLKVM